MVHRVVFWGGFGALLPPSILFPPPATWFPTHSAGLLTLTCETGVAVNIWRLGLEMRPFFNRGTLWTYPVFASVGASFGYWIQGVDERQVAVLENRKQVILDKRARRAVRDADQVAADNA